MPAVIQCDGTVCPQRVSQDFDPWVHQVLHQFKKIMEVSLLLNTSFNQNGLPIVGAPADALSPLVNDWGDGLSIGRR